MMLGPSVAKGFETLSANHGFSKWEQPHFIQCLIIVFTCFHHKKFHVLGVHKVNNGKYTTFSGQSQWIFLETAMGWELRPWHKTFFCDSWSPTGILLGFSAGGEKKTNLLANHFPHENI